MSLIGGGQPPMDVDARLELLSQQLDELQAWYKRTFIASWVVIAVATGFLVYSYLPSEIKPLADRLNEINSRLERIETKLLSKLYSSESSVLTTIRRKDLFSQIQGV